MKHRFERAPRILLLLALGVGLVWGYSALNAAHQAAYPGLYATPPFLLILLAIFLLLVTKPLVMALTGAACGYRLKCLQLLFVEITRRERLHVRLTGHIRLGILMLPPRTDGTAPCQLYVASPFLCYGALAGLALLLSAVFWQTSAARSLLYAAFLLLLFLLVSLLPSANRLDGLSVLLALRRSREFRRSWACAMYINGALMDDCRLIDMPEEWFLTELPSQISHPMFQAHITNSVSRRMRQGRFGEAYALLQPLLALPPAPATHAVIACSILNGAVCEALAALPPVCLNQLEQPSVQYMTPAAWQPRYLTALYARALLIDRDEKKAGELLAQLRQADPAQIEDEMICLLQAKAENQTKENPHEEQ